MIQEKEENGEKYATTTTEAEFHEALNRGLAVELDTLKFESDGTGRLSIRPRPTRKARVRRGDVVGYTPLSTQAARAIIKGRASAADLQGRFSAQSLAASGASLVEMQTAGR